MLCGCDITYSNATNTSKDRKLCRNHNEKPHNIKQDAQLSQRDRAAGCVIVFAKNRKLELGDNILRTL